MYGENKLYKSEDELNTIFEMWKCVKNERSQQMRQKQTKLYSKG